MAFQTDKKPLPDRLWGDGVNPVSGGFGSNHSGRLMLTEGVCAPGCGAQPYLEETPESYPVFSLGTDVQGIVPAGSGWQPNGG